MGTRRAFMWACAVGGGAWPLAGGAQPAGKVKRVGWLDASSFGENLGVFMLSMKARGWVEGTSFKFEYRGADGSPEKLADAAAELVQLRVDVVVAPSSAEALAAQRASATTPIVMVGVDDPVGLGLVRSLGRPGTNVTGLSTARGELSGKLLSLLREQFPRATSAGVIWDATDPDLRHVVGHLQSAATTLGMTLQVSKVQHHSEVEPAIVALHKAGQRLLVVPPSPMLVPRWLADLSRGRGMALASTSPAYAYEGGLMSYSADWRTVYQQLAAFVDRILKGEKPSELPVELPTKYKLVLNNQTARELNLALAASLKLRADHVVE